MVINCTWMPSFIYQDVINLIVCFPIRRSASVFMNAATWEHCTLTIRCFGVARFADLTTCKLSFPIVGLKISSLHIFSLISPNHTFVWYCGNLSNTRCNYTMKSLLLAWVYACTSSTMISHQRSFRAIYDILLLTNSTLLTANLIPLCTKKPVPK